MDTESRASTSNSLSANILYPAGTSTFISRSTSLYAGNEIFGTLNDEYINNGDNLLYKFKKIPIS